MDQDPFAGLTVTEIPDWLARHRYYVAGWRDDVRWLCSEYGVPLIETEEVFATFPSSDALVVVTGLGERVPDSVLAEYGDWAFNVHASLLWWATIRGPRDTARRV